MDLFQQDLADRGGTSRQTINAIEKWDYNPTINHCRFICHIPRSVPYFHFIDRVFRVKIGRLIYSC